MNTLEQIISVKLEVFEGPLDLLLYLLKKNKVSIYDIPIVNITKQYMEYLSLCGEFDIELSAEFLVMASELLLIKSKMLLPKPEDDEEDPRTDLANRLLQYQRMKILSEFLKVREYSSRYNFFRKPEDIQARPADYSDQMFDIEILISAFADLTSRAERKAPPPKSSFGAVVPHEIVPMESRLRYIRQKLKKGCRTSFKSLFSEITSRAVMIATFLALLEMIKSELIIAESCKNDVYITKIKDGDTLDES